MRKHVFICIIVIFLSITSISNVVAKSKSLDVSGSYSETLALVNFSNLPTSNQAHGQLTTLSETQFSPDNFGIHLFNRRNIIPNSALRRSASVAMFGNITRNSDYTWLDEPYELIDTSRVAMNLRYGNARQNIRVTGRYLNNKDYMTKVVSYRHPINNVLNLNSNFRRTNGNEYTSLGFGLRLGPSLRLTGQVTTNLEDPELTKAGAKISYRF